MPDPLLEEFTRAHALRQDVFRRLQRHVRSVVQPKLDECDRLRTENAELQAELDKVQARAAQKKSLVNV